MIFLGKEKTETISGIFAGKSKEIITFLAEIRLCIPIHKAKKHHTSTNSHMGRRKESKKMKNRLTLLADIRFQSDEKKISGENFFREKMKNKFQGKKEK